MYSILKTPIIKNRNYAGYIKLPEGTKLLELVVENNEIQGVFIVPINMYLDDTELVEEVRLYAAVDEGTPFCADEFNYIGTVTATLFEHERVLYVLEFNGKNTIGQLSKEFKARYGEDEETAWELFNKDIAKLPIRARPNGVDFDNDNLKDFLNNLEG